MKLKSISILICILLSIFLPYQASATDDLSVVYAVLFYRPDCPHCHHFIENDYPLYQEEFGEQFQLIMINLNTDDGRALFLTAIETVPIPQDHLAVPMMIIGSEVLVGGNIINEYAPDLIRNGLAAGGIGLPNIPGLEIGDDLTAKNVSSTTSDSSISGDDIANSVAVILLLGLVFSALLTIIVGIQLFSSHNKQTIDWLTGKAGQRIQWGIGIVSVVIAFTLIIHETSDTFATVMASITTAALLIAVILIITTSRHPKKQLSRWSIPIIVIAGLAVAAYLSYVEVGDETAACGAMGDCNTVQQSQYANLFGIFPIGVIGIAGYLVILLLWIGTQFTSKRISEIAQGSLLIAALIGVMFSSYLTFLEPFVIEATCTWCLTSAAIMLMLLWLIFPTAWIAIDNLRHSPTRSKHIVRKHAH